MIPRTVFLSTPRQREIAKSVIDRTPDDYCVRFGKVTRTDKQNRKLWPMIADIQRQVPEMATFTAEQTKLRFMDALGCELTFLPKLEGAGMFPTGLKSSTLTVEQFGGLIELLYEYGARHGVEWTDPETRHRHAA